MIQKIFLSIVVVFLSIAPAFAGYTVVPTGGSFNYTPAWSGMNSTDGVELFSIPANLSTGTVYLHFGGSYHALSFGYCDGDAGGVYTYLNNWNGSYTNVRCYKAGVNFSTVTAGDFYTFVADSSGGGTFTALTTQSGVIVISDSGVSFANDASTKNLQSMFEIIKFLPTMALIAGGLYVLRAVMSILPGKGGGGKNTK